MPDQIDNMADATPFRISDGVIWKVLCGESGTVVLWDSAGVLRYHGQGLTMVAYHLVMSMAECDRLRAVPKSDTA
jgi:hypothetical protein